MNKPPLLTSNFAHLQEHDAQLLRLGMLAERQKLHWSCDSLPNRLKPPRNPERPSPRSLPQPTPQRRRDTSCFLPLLQELREIPKTRNQFIVSKILSLKTYPSLDGALGCSVVVVGFFVFLHGLPENRVDFLEMLDAFTEFSLFSHQQNVASLQFLKAQAQRFLLFAPVGGMGSAMTALPLKLCDRLVKHLAVFEQIKRL